MGIFLLQNWFNEFPRRSKHPTREVCSATYVCQVEWISRLPSVSKNCVFQSSNIDLHRLERCEAIHLAAGGASGSVRLCHHIGDERMQTLSQFQPAPSPTPTLTPWKPRTLADTAQLRCGDRYSRRLVIFPIFGFSSKRFSTCFLIARTMAAILWLFVPPSLFLIWYAAAIIMYPPPTLFCKWTCGQRVSDCKYH